MSSGLLPHIGLRWKTNGLAEKLAPQHIVETIHDKEMWTDVPALHRNLFASFVMTNNIRVAFSAFALGITFMIGTMYILAFNGILIGTVAGLCHVHGLALPLWSFVSPHGYIELTTIFIAGGAGLKMGYALIAPGLLTRKQALTDAAKIAVQLIGGCVVLLVIAGVIEGFVSPSSFAANRQNRIRVRDGCAVVLLPFPDGAAEKSADPNGKSRLSHCQSQDSSRIYGLRVLFVHLSVLVRVIPFPSAI